MLRYGIAQFVGSWVSESGYHLRIKKVRKGRASVDFLDPRGAPVQRPYMGGAPSLKMVAHYDDYNGMFEVDLWEEGKGFILDLTHEFRLSGCGKSACARHFHVLFACSTPVAAEYIAELWMSMDGT